LQLKFGRKKKWIADVEKASIQEWRKSEWHNLQWPMPIIQAFYLQRPDSKQNESPDEVESGVPVVYADFPEDSDTHNMLQRIVIHSEYLYQELLSIVSVSTMHDPIM
jgi:4-amino-4-deoxy-L-arabinose transferase-like glycosyltransferase